MGISSFDVCEPGRVADVLPLRVEQRSRVYPQIFKLLVLGPASVIVLLPLMSVALHLATEPSARAAVAERPAFILALIIATAAWGLLFAWPLARAVERLSARRSIVVADGRIEVVDRGPLGSRNVAEPIKEFRGIARHVRTAISGIRHELVLVHRDRGRSVVLAVSERIDAEDAARVARLLNLPEIEPSELYAVRPRGISEIDLRVPAEAHA